MLTTVMGSVAFAKTGNYSEYLGINGKGKKSFTGTAGVYTAELAKTRSDGYLKVSATSTSPSKRRYVVEAARTTKSGRTMDIDCVYDNMSRFRVLSTSIGRDYNEEFFVYSARVVVNNSTSEYTGICDEYKWTYYPVSR